MHFTRGIQPHKGLHFIHFLFQIIAKATQHFIGAARNFSFYITSGYAGGLHAIRIGGGGALVLRGNLANASRKISQNTGGNPRWIAFIIHARNADDAIISIHHIAREFVGGRATVGVDTRWKRRH